MNIKIIKRFQFIFAVLTCTIIISSKSHAAPDSQERRIFLLEQQLQQSKKELGDLKASLEKLQQSMTFDDILKDLDKIAFLKASSTGYETFKYDMGYLTISIVDIQPYADGTKITLSVGNPLYTALNGISANIEWGKLNDKGIPEGKSNEKQFKFVESLRAGSWTVLNVVLGGTRPADVGYIRFKDFKNTGIGLNR